MTRKRSREVHFGCQRSRSQNGSLVRGFFSSNRLYSILYIHAIWNCQHLRHLSRWSPRLCPAIICWFSQPSSPPQQQCCSLQFAFGRLERLKERHNMASGQLMAVRHVCTYERAIQTTIERLGWNVRPALTPISVFQWPQSYLQSLYLIWQEALNLKYSDTVARIELIWKERMLWLLLVALGSWCSSTNPASKLDIWFIILNF